jgi:hypothetical protein
MHPSSEQVTSGAHLRRIDISHRHHASSEQHSYLMSVYFVILCLAAMDGFHIKSMSQNKGYVFTPAEIGNPVPCKYALYCHNNVLTIRSYRFQKKASGSVRMFR